LHDTTFGAGNSRSRVQLRLDLSVDPTILAKGRIRVDTKTILYPVSRFARDLNWSQDQQSTVNQYWPGGYMEINLLRSC
jgi:hypothetical protein